MSEERLDETDAGFPYQEPLDDRTEWLITHVRGAADNFGRNGHLPRDHRILDRRTDALRFRIRTLVEEARKEGYAVCARRPGKLPEPEWDY